MELLNDGRELARRFYSRTFSMRTGNFTFDGAGAPGGLGSISEQYDGDNLTVRDMKVIKILPLMFIRLTDSTKCIL